MFNKIELKYDFKDLEPNIDEETMYTHYNKHYSSSAMPTVWEGLARG